MTMQPSPDLLDLVEAVAAGTLRADDAERQLRLELGSDRAAESEMAVRELRGLIGAAGAVRAHARATREAFGSASPDLAATVAPTPASFGTPVPGRVTAGAVHPRSSNGGEGAGRAPRRTWLLAAAALLLVGGAMAAGSGLVKVPSLVPPAPVPTQPVAVASPSPAVETPSPVVSPSTAQTPWITGQELMDALSAEYGYQWKSSVGPEATVTDVRSEPIRVEAPMDEGAWVDIGTSVDAADDDLLMHADRVAQALAPDATSWLSEAVPAALAAGPGSTATMTTASGGEVGVRFVDEPIIEDWFWVWFRPPPPPTRALEPSGGDVVYTESYQRGGEDRHAIRVMNADGTDAMWVRAGTWPAMNVSEMLGWSADGSRLFYKDGDSVKWIDASGSEPVQVAGGLEQVTLSRDGTKLVYPMDGDRGRNTIGILDTATGQVTEVTFAMDARPGERPCEGPFGGEEPQLSPDGTRFVFGISVGPKVDRFCRAAIYTVASDGTGLRRLNPSNVNAMGPRWTPDGSILFDSPRPRPAPGATGDLTAVPVDRDIYSVRPDGSGLTALTSDGVSTLVTSWTRDGRIVFNRHAGPDSPGELWIMDADGSNAAPLGNTLAAQTAAGCVVCPYVNESQQISFRYWQPMPGDRP